MQYLPIQLYSEARLSPPLSLVTCVYNWYQVIVTMIRCDITCVCLRSGL